MWAKLIYVITINKMNYVNEQIKTLIKKGIDQQKKYIIKLNFTTIENFEDEIGGSINDLWDYWQESFLTILHLRNIERYFCRKNQFFCIFAY